MSENIFQEKYNEYLAKIEKRIEEYVKIIEPKILYEPFKYILSIGGKRIRPVLTMICAGAVGGDVDDAIDSGVAMEILHNFTLVHDDIMDESPLRRNHQTVHTKWDNSTAIITGDVMVGYAYNLLPSATHQGSDKILQTFTKGLIEVCEGQAYDMQFNKRKDVTIEDYLLMIKKKTSLLIETASIIGGYIASANDKQIEALQQYSEAIGLAFQIQDDLLDIIAEQDKLGKTIGLDIIEGKKTYLIIKALEKAQSNEDKELLNKFYNGNGLSKEYIPKMKEMFERLNVLEEAQNEVERYFKKAEKQLQYLPDNFHKNMLKWIIDKLDKRKY